MDGNFSATQQQLHQPTQGTLNVTGIGGLTNAAFNLLTASGQKSVEDQELKIIENGEESPGLLGTQDDKLRNTNNHSEKRGSFKDQIHKDVQQVLAPAIPKDHPPRRGQ